MARVVHGEHPRQELVFANQHLRDQALSIIRREDHTAIEWAAECLKGGGETMVKLLTELFNKCWSQGLTHSSGRRSSAQS